MKCRARLVIPFPDGATAEAVVAATSPDDGGYIATSLDATDVVAEAEAADPLALLRTIDDWLASTAVAERAARSGRAP